MNRSFTKSTQFALSVCIIPVILLSFLLITTYVKAEPKEPKVVDLISGKTSPDKPASPQKENGKPGNSPNMIILDNFGGENMLGAMPMLIQSDYWLGVRIGTVPPALFSAFGVKEGDPKNESEYVSLLYVDEVMSDGPARKSGLQRGDVILKCGEKKIGTLADLIAWVDEVKDKEQTLTVYRHPENKELKITPALRPEEARVGRQMPQGMPMQAFPFSGNGPQPRMDEMMRRMQEEMQRYQQGFPMPMTPFPQVPPPQPQTEEGILPPESPKSEAQGIQDSDGTDIRQNADSATEVRGQTVRASTRVQATGDNVERLEVSERIVDGKEQIRVKRVVQKGDDEDEKVWEVQSLDELPEEIREDVKAMLPK